MSCAQKASASSMLPKERRRSLLSVAVPEVGQKRRHGHGTPGLFARTAAASRLVKQDTDFLLAAILSHAHESPEFARRLISISAQLAAESADKSLRGYLKKALIPKKKGTRGRSKIDIAYCHSLRNDYEVLRSFGQKPGEAMDALARRAKRTSGHIRLLIKRSTDSSPSA